MKNKLEKKTMEPTNQIEKKQTKKQKKQKRKEKLQTNHQNLKTCIILIPSDLLF